MITREIFETIEGLNQAYFEKWGCAVDYSATTKNISPENLIKALRRIIETGEALVLQEDEKNLSLVMPYHKLFERQEKFQVYVSKK